jgi:hypothetical protein
MSGVGPAWEASAAGRNHGPSAEHAIDVACDILHGKALYFDPFHLNDRYVDDDEAASPTTPMAQMIKVFLLLFVHKKKPFFFASESR